MTALTKAISRKTSARASTYGRDAARRIVVKLMPGPSGQDMIELRPERTRRGRTMLLADLWSLMLRHEANRAWSEKALARKKAKAERKAARAAQTETRRLARAVISAQ